MSDPRHPKKEVRDVLRWAERRGGTVVAGGGHVWGRLFFARGTADEVRFFIHGTPRVPADHAAQLRRGFIRAEAAAAERRRLEQAELARHAHRQPTPSDD